MAVYRNALKCPKCGVEYNGIYRDNDGTFIGDDFVRWDIEGHVCPSAKSVEVEEAREIEWAATECFRSSNYGNGLLFVEGAKFGSTWQQQKQADTISRLREILEELANINSTSPYHQELRVKAFGILNPTPTNKDTQNS